MVEDSEKKIQSVPVVNQFPPVESTFILRLKFQQRLRLKMKRLFSVDFSMLDVEPVIYFCRMPEHNAATWHRADRAEQEVA